MEAQCILHVPRPSLPAAGCTGIEIDSIVSVCVCVCVEKERTAKIWAGNAPLTAPMRYERDSRRSDSVYGRRAIARGATASAAVVKAGDERATNGWSSDWLR